MTYKITLTHGALACALAFAATAYGQNVRTYIEFEPVADWDPTNGVEIDGGDESIDTSGAFFSVYGDITGNTIDRASFKTAVAAAHAAGLGGVVDFESATFSDVDHISPNTGLPVGRADEGASMKVGDMFIERGPNHYFEGNFVSPYRGRDTVDFDGTGPSGPDRANPEDTFFFESAVDGSPEGNELGRDSGLATSYDLDFDPADKVSIVGIAMLGYDNFQSFSGVALGGYPNMHAIATFTNGVDSIDHMAVGISEQVADGNDHYFGFEAPDGYFLDRLQAYQIGNNGRAFIQLDELGFVRVPEPSSMLLIALFGSAALVRRRAV